MRIFFFPWLRSFFFPFEIPEHAHFGHCFQGPKGGNGVVGMVGSDGNRGPPGVLGPAGPIGYPVRFS
jgi:hypothetical protein